MVGRASMRIAASSFGSEGDIRPFVALVRALRAAGHDAFLCAAEMFRERADQAGIPFSSTGAMRNEAGMRAGFERVMREPNPVKNARLVFECAAEEMMGRLEPMLDYTRGADLVIHHIVDAAGFAAAKVHGLRRVSVSLAPGIWNNREVVATGASYGLLGNLAMGAFIRLMFPYMTDRWFRPIIEAAKLPGPRKNIILESASSPDLNFLAVSPSMLRPDPRWTPAQRQTGYWFLDLPDYQPPPALKAFVESGDPPLVIGFGSMAGVDAQKHTESIVGAVERLGRRAVLLSGWAELGKGTLPSSIHVADHVPHDWLYPRAALVVHHGGAGTTAAVTRAGVPHAMVWHLGDQSAWGSLISRLGLGPAPLHHQKLTAERLARHIAAADRPRAYAAARAMAARIRAEDGLGEAVRAISALAP